MSLHRRNLLLLCCLTLGAYYFTIFAPFNSLDDRALINYLINKDGFSFEHYIFPTGPHSYYRPLIGLSYELDKYVWGLTENFMHLENILLHLANVILVYFIARKLHILYFTDHVGLFSPLFVAALFSLHPINTETVNWIMARSDLLAGFFVLSAFLCVLQAFQSNALRWAWAAALLLLLGSMSKETALMVVPGTFCLILAQPDGPQTVSMPLRRRFLLLGILSLGACLYLALRMSSQWHDQGVSIAAHTFTSVQKSTPTVITTLPVAEGLSSESSRSFFRDIAEPIVTTIGFYAKKLVWPWPLNFAIDRVSAVYFWPGLSICLLLPWLAWRQKIWSALCLSGFAFVTVALLVTLAPVAWTPVAERYMYIPLALLVLALLSIRDRWFSSESKRIKNWLIALLLVVLAASVVSRNIVWLNNLDLYQNAVANSPDFAPARNELAIALYESGRINEALAIYATLENPDNQLASLSKVNALVEAHAYDEAKQFLLERMSKTPGYERTILEYLLKINDLIIESEQMSQPVEHYYREQLVWLARLQEVSGDAFYWYRQGRIYLLLKEPEQAQRCFANAAKGLPKDSPYYEPARKLSQRLKG